MNEQYGWEPMVHDRERESNVLLIFSSEESESKSNISEIRQSTLLT